MLYCGHGERTEGRGARMPDMDQGIKRLIQTHPADVLTLVGRLPMNTDIIGTSSIYQQLVRETTERVRRETTERTLRDAALAVLRGRFPDLGDDVEAVIAAAREDLLRDVQAHAGTDTLEQLRARLGL